MFLDEDEDFLESLSLNMMTKLSCKCRKKLDKRKVKRKENKIKVIQ
jgi:hypothetical protein